MSNRNAPSARWNREHGFTNRQPGRKERGGKKIYHSWWIARIKCWWINRTYGDTMHVYSCYWGPDYRTGQSAKKHWHLGHATVDDMWGY